MNRKSVFASILTVSLLGASGALAADYDVDPAHSRLGFKIRHIVSNAEGEFRDYSGTFSFDPKKPDVSKANFVVKSASIFTANDKRDEHLRSTDFFDVTKHPTLSFVSKKVKPAGQNKYKLQGDLTIKGVTKPATFDVEYMGADKDPWGNMRAGFAATTKIKRKDYGLTFNKVLDSGGLMLGEDVELVLNIEAVQKK